MKFWDNMKKFAQPYADDDYDDYEEDEYLDDDYEEVDEQPARRAPRANKTTRAPRRTAAPAAEPAPAMQEDEDYEDDYAFSSIAKSAAPAAAPVSSNDFGGKVLNMSRGGVKSGIVLFRPGSFSDADKAADDLKKNQAVIVNLENVEKTMARRVVDFLSGCVYALDGKVSKIAQSAYLFCPNNVDISGDLESQVADIEQYV